LKSNFIHLLFLEITLSTHFIYYSLKLFSFSFNLFGLSTILLNLALLVSAL
jgi:hypothetical protein